MMKKLVIEGANLVTICWSSLYVFYDDTEIVMEHTFVTIWKFYDIFLKNVTSDILWRSFYDDPRDAA